MRLLNITPMFILFSRFLLSLLLLLLAGFSRFLILVVGISLVIYNFLLFSKMVLALREFSRLSFLDPAVVPVCILLIVSLASIFVIA